MVVYRECEAVCGLVLLALLAEERATSLQDFGWVEARVESGRRGGFWGHVASRLQHHAQHH